MAAPSMPAGRVPAEVLREAAQFLFLEADLLDRWQLDDWFALFTDDCCYWIPTSGEDVDPETETSLIYDHRDELRTRVIRVQSPLAHSQVPRTRTSRLVGNVRVLEYGLEHRHLSSNFVVYETRLGRDRVLAGHAQHVLRLVDGEWRIALKKVILNNTDGALSVVTILL